MNGDDMPMIDAPKVFMDAPVQVPQMITIAGVTTETGISGTTNVAGATLQVFVGNDTGTPLAMATSDAQGKWSMTVMTMGAPLDAFVKATKSGYVDIYMYPEAAFTKDSTDGDINMLTPSNKDFLNSLAGGGQMAGKGMIGLQVRDAAGMPVAGAEIESTPASGAYRYTNSSGYPTQNATTTSADGVAFMFNVPPNMPIVVKAKKTGMTFKSHTVETRPDKFTTTSIVQ